MNPLVSWDTSPFLVSQQFPFCNYCVFSLKIPDSIVCSFTRWWWIWGSFHCQARGFHVIIMMKINSPYVQGDCALTERILLLALCCPSRIWDVAHLSLWVGKKSYKDPKQPSRMALSFDLTLQLISCSCTYWCLSWCWDQAPNCPFVPALALHVRSICASIT